MALTPEQLEQQRRMLANPSGTMLPPPDATDTNNPQSQPTSTPGGAPAPPPPMPDPTQFNPPAPSDTVGRGEVAAKTGIESPAPSTMLPDPSKPLAPPSSGLPDPTKAAAPAGPLPAFYGPHAGLRGGLASAFAGLSDAGAALNRQQGHGMEMVDNWGNRNRAAAEAERNKPYVQQQTQLGVAGKEADINEQLARTNLTNVQAIVANQNLPMQEKAEAIFNNLRDAWTNKSAPDFDKFAQVTLAGMPPALARMVAPHLEEIKKLPQTGKGYALTMQDDLPKSINVYGKEMSPDDPNLPPGAKQEFDNAMAAHNKKIDEETTKEQRVAGLAADRQAAGFTNAANVQNRQHQFELDNKMRADVQKEDLDFSDSQQRHDQLTNAVDLAQKGNVIEAQNAVLKTLGLSLDGITKRINTTELAKFEDAGSSVQRLQGSLGKLTTGNPWPDSVWNDVKAFADDSLASAQKKHDRNVSIIHTSYGHPDQSAPAAGPSATGPNGHKITVKGGKWVDAQTGAPI